MSDTVKYIQPEHIQIETIVGVCTARCIMCPMHRGVTRPYHVMDLVNFGKILKKCKSFTNQKYLTLHGLAEPLLDKEIHRKVALAKSLGYRGIGFASNCTELTHSMAMSLLDAGLDTLICSIDGMTKEVHESIRIGTSFDKVVANVLNFLRVRNEKNCKTRVLIRFIRQTSNSHEWEEYRKYWQALLNQEIGDGVLRFDVHNWGGGGDSKDGAQVEQYCDDLLNRIIIESTGRLALCCGGYSYKDSANMGNVLVDDPLELYNSPPFTIYRDAMRHGHLRDLSPCSECNILINRQTRILPNI